MTKVANLLSLLLCLVEIAAFILCFFFFFKQKVLLAKKVQ